MKQKPSRSEKNPLSSLQLARISRPKVYITESSSFKMLVQELTGNGNTSLVDTTPPYTDNQFPVFSEENHEGGLEVSVDAPIVSADSWNQVLLQEEINQPWSQIYEDVTSVDSPDSQKMDFLAIRNLETWLLDDQDISTIDYQFCSYS